MDWNASVAFTSATAFRVEPIKFVIFKWFSSATAAINLLQVMYDMWTSAIIIIIIIHSIFHNKFIIRWYEFKKNAIW